MKWSEVLDPSLSPQEILCERLPAMHASRRAQFQAFSKTSIIASLYFADTTERFTALFDGEAAEVEQGEMIDFPQVTVQARHADWSRAIALLARLVEPADEQLDRYQGRVVLTEELKDEFERFDGVFSVRVTGLPDGGPIEFDIILNDYEAPPRAKSARLEVGWPLLVDLAHGRIEPAEFARQIKIGGAMGLALEIGGFMASRLGLGEH